MYEAYKVSREFCDALVPRKKKQLALDRFLTFESFWQMNFLGMEYFSSGKSSILMNETTCIIASDQQSYPNSLYDNRRRQAIYEKVGALP
jgi:hypothetical protein